MSARMLIVVPSFEQFAVMGTIYSQYVLGIPEQGGTFEYR